MSVVIDLRVSETIYERNAIEGMRALEVFRAIHRPASGDLASLSFARALTRSTAGSSLRRVAKSSASGGAFDRPGQPVDSYRLPDNGTRLHGPVLDAREAWPFDTDLADHNGCARIKKCAAGVKIIRFHPVRSAKSVSYAAAPGNNKIACQVSTRPKATQSSGVPEGMATDSSLN